MKCRVLFFPVLLMMFTPMSLAGSLLTFDNLGNVAQIPNGYGDLTWSNFFSLDSTTYSPNSGYVHAVVSLKNIAYNANAAPATISSANPFDLTSAYFTAAWNDGLTIVATGYRGGLQVASKTFLVNSVTPTLEVFNFSGIDTVNFMSFGGTNHGYNGGGTHFAMDNLLINGNTNVVPEPSTFLMSGIAVVAGLGARARRRYAA